MPTECRPPVKRLASSNSLKTISPFYGYRPEDRGRPTVELQSLVICETKHWSTCLVLRSALGTGMQRREELRGPRASVGWEAERRCWPALGAPTPARMGPGVLHEDTLAGQALRLCGSTRPPGEPQQAVPSTWASVEATGVEAAQPVRWGCEVPRALPHFLSH